MPIAATHFGRMPILEATAPRSATGKTPHHSMMEWCGKCRGQWCRSPQWLLLIGRGHRRHESNCTNKLRAWGVRCGGLMTRWCTSREVGLGRKTCQRIRIGVRRHAESGAQRRPDVTWI